MSLKVLTASLMLAVAACGDDATGSGGTGGTGTTSSKASSSAKAATNVATGTGGAGADGTSGLPCTDDSMCDASGTGMSQCTNASLFTDGSLYPDPLCLSIAACDLGDGSAVTYCDADTGTCVATQDGGVCFPYCFFDDSGTQPKGNCPGKDVCNVYGFGKDNTDSSFGVGFCYGGCLVDADCKVSGEKCDVGDGLCKAAANIVQPTKQAGAACSGNGDTACNCFMPSGLTTGMCLQACKVDDPTNACPAGTVCDAELPATGDVPFTKEPPGLAGYCRKTCTLDGECPTTPSGYCYASAGHVEKTCHFGAAP